MKWFIPYSLATSLLLLGVLSSPIRAQELPGRPEVALHEVSGLIQLLDRTAARFLVVGMANRGMLREWLDPSDEVESFRQFVRNLDPNRGDLGSEMMAGGIGWLVINALVDSVGPDDSTRSYNGVFLGRALKPRIVKLFETVGQDLQRRPRGIPAIIGKKLTNPGAGQWFAKRAATALPGNVALGSVQFARYSGPVSLMGIPSLASSGKPGAVPYHIDNKGKKDVRIWVEESVFFAWASGYNDEVRTRLKRDVDDFAYAFDLDESARPRLLEMAEEAISNQNTSKYVHGGELDFLAMLKDLTDDFDEPFADDSAIMAAEQLRSLRYDFAQMGEDAEKVTADEKFQIRVGLLRFGVSFIAYVSHRIERRNPRTDKDRRILREFRKLKREMNLVLTKVDILGGKQK